VWFLSSCRSGLVLNSFNGRAVSQAVRRWLPTAAARIRVRAACDVGFVVDKASFGRVFAEYFGFPCQSFHQFLHHHNHPGLAAAVPNGPWIPPPQYTSLNLNSFKSLLAVLRFRMFTEIFLESFLPSITFVLQTLFLG
jgi:hypothetical protein